jgi:anti-sigma-K factor RskA
MDQRQIEELLPFYALGVLAEDERRLVEDYLGEHPEARPRADEMAEAVSALPYSVLPVEPSRRTKEALMARIARDADARALSKNQPSRRETRWAGLVPAFSLGAALVAIVWAVVLNIQLARLQAEVSILGDALVAQSNSLEEINAKLPQTSPAVTISLKGTEAQPDARGQLIADQDSHSAVLVIAGLSQLEPGKTYQVWLINASGPQSAGLLAVDTNGQGLLILTSDLPIGEFDALGISIEPDGGSEQPTGEIVVLSEL